MINTHIDQAGQKFSRNTFSAWCWFVIFMTNYTSKNTYIQCNILF